MTIVRSCSTLDCVLNDKKGLCTSEEIEISTYNHSCMTFKSDKKWLDAQLHERMRKYFVVPIYDEYASGPTIVEVDKNEK